MTRDSYALIRRALFSVKFVQPSNAGNSYKDYLMTTNILLLVFRGRLAAAIRTNLLRKQKRKQQNACIARGITDFRVLARQILGVKNLVTARSGRPRVGYLLGQPSTLLGSAWQKEQCTRLFWGSCSAVSPTEKIEKYENTPTRKSRKMFENVNDLPMSAYSGSLQPAP